MEDSDWRSINRRNCDFECIISTGIFPPHANNPPITPVANETPTSVIFTQLPTPTGTLVFSENFNEGIATGLSLDALAADYTKSATINENNGNDVFQIENESEDRWTSFALNTSAISDGTIEYKLKLVATNAIGTTACNFRSSSQSQYVVALDPSGLSINYQGADTNQGWIF